MTMLGLVFMLMISAALIFITAPFRRKFGEHRLAFSGQLEVFRDQLQEVDRQAAEGLIDADQIETARLEIKRQLLRADRANETFGARLMPTEQNLAVVGVAGIVALGSLGIYAVKGSPDLSSSPASGRVAGLSAADADGRLTATRHLQADIDRKSKAAAELDTVDVMIKRLGERLRKSPNNPEGWGLLGWSYMRTGRFPEAATAYAKAVELRPDVPSLWAARGEALVEAANGRVTDEARINFDEVLKRDRNNPRARFFKGLAKEQAGDKAAALDDWVGVLNDVPADEEWVTDLKQRIAELAFDLNVDVAGKIGHREAAASGDTLKLLKEQYGLQPATAPEKGPTAEDLRSAEALAPADRIAMIRGMVDGLAGRLEQSPRDLEGWIELIRSRTILREMDAAKQALDRALEVFADSPQNQRRIMAAAEQLGLTR